MMAWTTGIKTIEDEFRQIENEIQRYQEGLNRPIRSSSAESQADVSIALSALSGRIGTLEAREIKHDTGNWPTLRQLRVAYQTVVDGYRDRRLA